MKKIIVIGCPGSGKSTFARKLHELTKLPLYHLDIMYWNEDKTTVSKEIFLERLSSAMKNPRWIIDGNYASTMEIRIKSCDTIFFLDYPTDVCMDGIRCRKGKTRPDMPWIENGATDDEFIAFVNNYNTESRTHVLELIKKYPSKNVIVFNSRRDSEEFLLNFK